MIKLKTTSFYNRLNNRLYHKPNSSLGSLMREMNAKLFTLNDMSIYANFTNCTL